MRKRGWVVKTENERATVCFEQKEACKDCDAQKLCHAAGSRHLIVAENSIGARAKDEVYVEQAAGVGFVAAFILFGLPVLLAVIGLLVGSHWHERASILGGLAGLILGLFVAKLINNRLSQTVAILPKITEIVKQKGS